MKQNKMFLFHRILRIYPPFWFVVVISLVLLKHSNFTLSSFLLLPGLEFNSSYGIPYWTLVYEMFFYLIFYLLIIFKLSKEKIINFMIFWLANIIIFNIYHEVYYPVPYLYIFFSSINIFFIFGVCIALNQEIYQKITSYQLFLIIIIGYQFLQISKNTLYHTIEALICSAILLIFIKYKPSKLIVILGNSSYGLYLIHDICIKGTISLVNKFNISIKLYQLCLLTLIISGIIGIIYGFAESEFHRKLTGWIKQKRTNISSSKSKYDSYPCSKIL